MAKLVKLKPTPAGETRWGVRWKENGKERQQSFKSKTEAQAFRSQKEVEVPRQRRTLKPTWTTTPTFEAVARDYLKSLETAKPGRDAIEARTVKTYRSILETHVLPHLGAKAVDNVASDDFIRVHTFCTQEAMSPRTRNEALRLTRAVLLFASASNYIDAVPENPIKNRLSRAERQTEILKRDEKFFSPDEIYTLLEAADSLAEDESKRTRNSWARYRPMVYFLVYTGARISEARAFTRDNYRPDTGWIHITHSAPEGEGSSLVKATDSIRRIPINPELRGVLDECVRSHKRALLFGTPSDKPMSMTTLYPRLLTVLYDRADALAQTGDDPRFVTIRRDRKFHAFRHHFASWLVKEGASAKQLQSYMGHAKFAFTMDVYGHLFDDDGADLAARMSMR